MTIKTQRTAMIRGLVLGVAIGATLIATPAIAEQTSNDNITAIRAGTIHVGNGERITEGVVLITGDRITAVGNGIAIPEGARVIDMPEASITPGLIDANAALEPTDLVAQPENQRRGVLHFLQQPHPAGLHMHNGTMTWCDGTPLAACSLSDIHDDLEDGQICPVCGGLSPEGEAEAFASGTSAFASSVEASSEVVPHTLMVDTINFKSPDFQRLLRGGVTTVYASPDSAAVIGPQGAIVRTAGPLRDRVIREADAVEANFGSDPFRVGAGNGSPNQFNVSQRTRRPQSRMGVAFVFRKAFYDAERHAAGVELTGSDQAPPEALELVQEIREGDINLRVQARTQRDILTAMRLADEFGLSFTLLEPIEAYRCIDDIAARDMGVVFGPIFIDPGVHLRRNGEGEMARFTTMRALLDAGIPTALSAQNYREEDGLARQAMYAMRSGLTLDEAVQCVTSTPAALLGLDDELGTIEAGKRADLVVWNGEPFSATSTPVVVIVGGHVEYESE